MRKYGGLKIKKNMSFNPVRVVEQAPNNTLKCKVEYFTWK